MSKVKLPAILLNADFYTKPRNRKWLAENGAEAVIILQAFWIASSQESNCKIRKADVAWLSLPIQMEPSTIIYILESAVLAGLLDEDTDHFFNSQIVKDSTSFTTKRENYKKGRQKRDGVNPESCENPQIILGESNENYIVPVLVTEPEPVIDLIPKKEKPSKPSKTKFLEFVYLSESELEKFKDELGEPVLTRCIEKLDAWIASDPTIKRKKNGQNAAACFRSWVINSIAEEQGRARAGPAKSGATINGYGANHIKNMETLARLEAEEAANGQ